MNKQAIKKKLVTAIRYIYRIGIIKSLLICFAISVSGAEYEVKWKGRHFYLRKGTSDFRVFRQIMVFGQYNINRIRSQEVQTIVDLGANIGMSVLHFKSKYPQAHIIAVEPEKSNFDLLVKNVAGYNDVHCLQNAIWYDHNELNIYDSGLGEYAFRVVDENEKKVGTVKAATMDDIIQRFHIETIDILKVDIEGAEKELFTYNYESWLPKVQCIVIELHDLYRPGCATAFFKAISNREFTIFCKGEDIVINFSKPTTTIAHYG